MTIHRGRNRIFGITWLCYAGYYLCRKNLGVVIPLLLVQPTFSEYGLAAAVSLYSLFYATCQFVTGPLSDRFGPRIVVIVGLSLVIASNVLMGVSVNSTQLLILACVNGMGQSTGWSALVKCMASWWGSESRGIVMAWWTTNYVLGGFAATAFATYVATSQWLFPQLGWRRGFLVPAAVLLGVLILFAKGVQDAPEAEAPTDVLDGKTPEASGSHRVTWQETLQLLRQPVLWIISSAFFLLELARYAFLFWLPFILTRRLAYSTNTAGYLSSLYDLIGFAGVILTGYLSDKVFHGRRLFVSAIMLAGLAIMLAMQSLLPGAGVVLVGAWVGLCGLLTYGPDTILSGAAAQDLGSARLAGSAAGFIDGMGHLGSILSPVVVVSISQRAGWTPLFLFLSGCTGVSAIILACAGTIARLFVKGGPLMELPVAAKD
jgi:sugar phosphate permease